MAMRKQPERRYATAEQLSEDLRRHLAALPVIARRDSVFYRARKFAGRYRMAVAASVLAVAALLITTATAVIQQRRAQRRFNELRRFASALIEDPGRPLMTLATRERALRAARESLDSLAADSREDTGIQKDIAAAYRAMAAIRSRPVGGMGDSATARLLYEKEAGIYGRLYARDPNDLEIARRLASAYLAEAQETPDPAAAIAILRKALQIVEPRVSQSGFAGLRLPALFRIADFQLRAGDPRTALKTIAEAG